MCLELFCRIAFTGTLNVKKIDVMLKCSSFEGEKNILFIFDLIVIISRYYIHKVKWTCMVIYTLVGYIYSCMSNVLLLLK